MIILIVIMGGTIITICLTQYLACYSTTSPIKVNLKVHSYAIVENVETISVGWGSLVVKSSQRLFDRLEREKRNDLGGSFYVFSSFTPPPQRFALLTLKSLVLNQAYIHMYSKVDVWGNALHNLSVTLTQGQS